MEDTLKCYQVLGVEPGASAKRVRAAYLDLARTWDPERHVNNPVLRAEAEKKRKEIDEAYKALRTFLPELQGPLGEREKSPDVERDFKELATEAPVESTRTFMGILVAVILIAIFAWAFYLLMKGRSINPTPSVPIE